MKTRLLALALACSMAATGCETMDAKTQGAVIGGAIGCAGGAVFAKLTKNDIGTACAAGAVVGGLVGYLRARNAEVQEAQQAAQEAVHDVPGAHATPVETQTVQVTDRETHKTDHVQAFKSVSVDIPVSQIDTADGRAAVAKLDAYARKVAAERSETVDMTVASASGKGASASPVALRQTSEVSGKGQVKRTYTADPRVPATVQRYTIEAKNRDKVEV
jgi:hypothetical protein